jgi:hypothetical protein
MENIFMIKISNPQIVKERYIGHDHHFGHKNLNYASQASLHHSPLNSGSITRCTRGSRSLSVSWTARFRYGGCEGRR